jgi:tight adherence protein B
MSENMAVWLPALLAFVAVAFGIIAIALLIEGLRATVRRRDLSRRMEQALAELQEQTMVERSLLDEGEARRRETQRLAERLPLVGSIALLMGKARLSWSPMTFILLTAGFAVAGGVFALAAGLPLMLALFGSLALGWLPFAYANHRRKRLLRSFEELLPEAIDYLARAIRSGHPLTSGIQMVGEELGDPLGAEFRRLFDQQRFGVPFEEALLGMCDRVELVDIRIFATSIIVQREVGGASFGEVLDNMAETIRARFAIRREIDVYTAQGRLSGMIVGQCRSSSVSASTCRTPTTSASCSSIRSAGSWR